MFKAGDFAKMVGVHIKTLQKWDKNGVLPAHRTITNRRYYTYEDYYKVLGQKDTTPEDSREEVKVG